MIRKYSKIWSSLIAVAVGLLVGFAILLFANSEYAYEGIVTILEGGFNEGLTSGGNMLFQATPIILTGLSVGFAYKTGLFNIGASGQFTVGGFTAIIIALYLPPGISMWLLAILGAIIAGAIWGSIVGVLKAYLNMNEVISSIMLNYIAMYTVNYLVVQFALDQVRNQTLAIPELSRTPIFLLNQIFPGSEIDIGIFIALVVAFIIYVLLNNTVFGYELKAVGFNRHAGQYAGINEKRSVILSMAISGALSGLAGALTFLAASPKFIEVVDVIQAEGFTGIPVALLGQLHPFGIVFSGIFIAHLNLGGFYMQSYGFVPEIIGIIIGAIIYCASFAILIQELIKRRRKRGKN